jgi:acyl-CoA thioester hydrolase
MSTVPMVGHVEPVRINFDDLDATGVLHNARYALLVERALATYWERRGWPFDPTRPQFADIFFVVREFTITYRRPITAVGEVGVHFWFDEVGTTSSVYGFRVLSGDGSVVHAEGRRAQVKLDPATRRPSRISDAVYEACRPLFADPDAERAAS